MKVAFLGLGRMGRLMAGHVLDGGHELTVWNRSSGATEALVARGAREASSPSEAARGCDVVVTMLFGPESVREVLLGPDGVVHGAAPGTLVVDSTSIGPDAARRLASDLDAHGFHYVDAPVAGSLAPAAAGALTVLVGGADDDVARARPLLELWGDPEKVTHVGPVGSASALKLVVNLPLGVTAAALGEALALAADLGVDRSAALRALAAGPLGWFLAQKGDLVSSGEFAPTTFSLELMAKDLRLAVEQAAGALPAATTALHAAESGVADGRGGEDYAALSSLVRAPLPRSG